MNQKWYIHTMEYLAAVKRKKKDEELYIGVQSGFHV